MKVSRVRTEPTGTDSYGEPIAGTSTTTEIDGAFVAPRTSSELVAAGRDGVIIGLTLFAPHGTDLNPAIDEILVEDDGANDGLYRIDGQPGDWSFRLGSNAPAGQSTALVRVDG